MELCTLPFSAIYLKLKIGMNMRTAESCWLVVDLSKLLSYIKCDFRAINIEKLCSHKQ